MRSKRIWRMLAGAALAMTAAGCGWDPAAPAASADGTGAIQMALSSMVGATTYVLANATFGISRIQPPPTDSDAVELRLHPTDPTAGDLTVRNLPVGRYTVTLLDGWQLERED